MYSAQQFWQYKNTKLQLKKKKVFLIPILDTTWNILQIYSTQIGALETYLQESMT